ncbi:MAG: hypothetical protein ACR2J7_00200 [Luteimonas sp.]
MVIAAILALYAALLLGNWRSELHERYVEHRQYLRKVRTLAGENEWAARAEAMSRARSALEAQIPDVASVSLAQAAAQTWLRELAAVHGTAVQIQSQAPQPVEDQPGLWRVPVVIGGALPSRAVLNIIRQIETRSSLAVIEEAMILNRDNRTFQLTVVSYFRVGKGGADAPG